MKHLLALVLLTSTASADPPPDGNYMFTADQRIEENPRRAPTCNLKPTEHAFDIRLKGDRMYMSMPEGLLSSSDFGHTKDGGVWAMWNAGKVLESITIWRMSDGTYDGRDGYAMYDAEGKMQCEDAWWYREIYRTAR